MSKTYYVARGKAGTQTQVSYHYEGQVPKQYSSLHILKDDGRRKQAQRRHTKIVGSQATSGMGVEILSMEVVHTEAIQHTCVAL